MTRAMGDSRPNRDGDLDAHILEVERPAGKNPNPWCQAARHVLSDLEVKERTERPEPHAAAPRRVGKREHQQRDGKNVLNMASQRAFEYGSQASSRPCRQPVTSRNFVLPLQDGGRRRARISEESHARPARSRAR